MATVLYSAVHFLVDFACAHRMYQMFLGLENGVAWMLVYNFCAFALQMPLGAVLDAWSKSRKRLPGMLAAVGVGLTVLGTFTNPVILGIGNAAFHVGGGVGVIRQDNARRWNGRGLGVFVAPGALGLYFGARLTGGLGTILLIAALCLAAAALPFLPDPEPEPQPPAQGKGGLILACCFLVVVLRSFVGMAVVFPWKQEPSFAFLAVCAVVLGKAAGGFAAACLGSRRTVVGSLVLSAVCYFLGNTPAIGILALFFFNMTMPITLYTLARRYPELPGFAFGLLTFGLFLGFLPVYAGLELPFAPSVAGCLGSALSLALLEPAVREVG